MVREGVGQVRQCESRGGEMMKPLNYVRRCKNKIDNDQHKTLHAADNSTTFCGKELNEMWFIESSAGLVPEDVTCKKCMKVLRHGVEVAK